MRPIPLQLWEEGPVPEWAVAFGQVTDVLSALIGLFIAYHAYRGYRRNESRPMLFISVGFVLALGLPFVLLALYLVLPLPETPVGLLTQTSQVVGLLAILYALRMPA